MSRDPNPVVYQPPTLIPLGTAQDAMATQQSFFVPAGQSSGTPLDGLLQTVGGLLP